MTVCSVPPEGWVCSREPGHEGPCAAWTDFPEMNFVRLPLIPGELVTSLVSLGRKLYVCTDQRIFELRPKVPWYIAVWKKIRRFCGLG
jgi:hypothetical protein